MNDTSPSKISTTVVPKEWISSYKALIVGLLFTSSIFWDKYPNLTYT